MLVVRDTVSITAMATESPTVESLLTGVPESDPEGNVDRANLYRLCLAGILCEVKISFQNLILHFNWFSFLWLEY